MGLDEDLVRKAREALPGDTNAFEQLVRKNQSAVFANCRYLTGLEVEAQDLAQEVFIKAYFSLRSFEGRSLFRTWLQRIKINHCITFLRSNRRTFMDITDSALNEEQALRHDPSALESLIGREERDRVRAILDSMPPQMRIPLVLCDLDGLSYKEVADSLGIGLSAAKMRIKRAREWFRSAYGPTTGPPEPTRDAVDASVGTTRSSR